jgi:hypothetical protein
MEIQEHFYTKYWEHKFSAHAFAGAMERAVRRLSQRAIPLPIRQGMTTMCISSSTGSWSFRT